MHGHRTVRILPPFMGKSMAIVSAFAFLLQH